MISRKLYYEIKVVRLDFRLVCRLISHYRSTLLTFMDYYVTFFSIGLCTAGSQNSAAVIGSVSGIHVNVQ